MMSNEGQSSSAAPEPTKTLKRRAVRGSLWWVGAYPILKAIQLGSSVVMARLLSPDAFGLLALAQVVHKGVVMCSEVGTRVALVQNPRTDAAFINTAWTIQVVRGVVIMFVTAALAYPMAVYYGRPPLMWLIVGVSFTSLIHAFESTKIVELNRRLMERHRATLAVLTTVVTRAAMIGVACVWPSAWAVVVGMIAGDLFNTIATHRIREGTSNRFMFEPRAARTIWSLGRWIMVGTIVAFAGSQIDKVLLGTLGDSSSAIGVLGVYAIAQRLASMPLEASGVLVGQTLLPAMSEIAREDRESFGPRFQRIRSVVLGPLMLATLAVVLLSPIFFVVLYDDRYRAATWMGPMICITTWLRVLNSTAHGALLTLGRTRLLAAGDLCYVAGTAGGALVGHAHFGVPGFIIGAATGPLLQHVVALVGLRREGISILGQDVAFTVLLVVSVLAGFSPVLFGPERSVFDPLSISVSIAVLLVLGGAVGWRSLGRLRGSKALGEPRS